MVIVKKLKIFFTILTSLCLRGRNFHNPDVYALREGINKDKKV